MSDNDDNVLNLEDERWIRWADKIGAKPVFIFKALTNFIEEKELEEDFEEYVKELMKN